MEKNSSRRKFLKNLGVAVGATTLVGSEAVASVAQNSNYLTQEHVDFLNEYEAWVEQYIEVVENEKKDRNNMGNKHRIMELSAQAENWQENIAGYLQNKKFKEKYIELSKKLANTITPELEA